MNDVSQKLAESLEALKELQEQGVVAIRSKFLTRSHRERLLKHGFIKEVIKGWYVASRPDEQSGDSTSWYTSYWEFCAAYLTERFGEQWCLSPEQSLNLHIGNKTVPNQLLVYSPKAKNNVTNFLYDTSIVDVQVALQDANHMTKIENINVLSLSAALINCSPKHYVNQPIQLRTALAMATDASDILSVLLAGGKSVVAGRIAGAFRNIGRSLIADNIVKGMDAADYKVQEVDPFEDETPITFGRREISPYVNRMRLMWATMRELVIEHFPQRESNELDIEQYLSEVEDKYVIDAYHSLSIEGYRVSHELIKLIRSGNWKPDQNDESKKHLDAMAAKGYWDAFQEVKKSLTKVLEGDSAGEVLEVAHGDWYIALFSPSVAAGIVQQSDLAGYRTGSVYIRKSMHTPPSREAIRDMMPTLFDLLSEEENAAVRVVLGHYIFVYIHPYFDGNGRMGRFIMNLMMASGGYPWTVVPVDRRSEYMQSLEEASINQNILPFTKFIASLL